MKLVHLSDLHLGKKLHGFDLCPDQRHIFKEIKLHIEEVAPDGVMIAGDIYDVPLPSGEAMRIFEDFLVFLSKLKKKPQVFIIYGNHDSGERLSFGSTLFEELGLHISPVFQGEISPITIFDAFGPVDFYLLPFLHPHQVGRDENDKMFQTAQEAIGQLVSGLKLDKNRRNIMITHQYVDVSTENPLMKTSESERYLRGGTELIMSSVFKDFDYVALGHLHNPQNVGSDRIRYCGSPLKYSASEMKYNKTLTVVELLGKNGEDLAELKVELLPLEDNLREIVHLKGDSESLLRQGAPELHQNDYVYLTLTDKERQIGMAEKLRRHFPYLLEFDYENITTLGVEKNNVVSNVEDISPLAIFQEFFSQQTAVIKDNSTELQSFSAEQKEYLEQLIDEIWGE